MVKMEIIDIGILVIIALPALVGLLFGFLNILFSLLAWTLALGVSIKFSSYFSPMLENTIEMPLIRNMLAFLGLFIVSLMILSIIGFLIVKLLGRTGLTSADRILGLFFGTGLGIAIVTMIVFLMGFTSVPTEQWWEESRIVTPFERISVWSSGYLPENIAKYHGYDPREGELKQFSEEPAGQPAESQVPENSPKEMNEQADSKT